MKRDFLNELKDKDGNKVELSKETIDSIMAEHGKTLNALKGELILEQGKVATLTKNNEEMQISVKALDGIDVEKLQSEIKTLNGKIAANEDAYKDDLKKITSQHAYDSALSDALRKAKSKNPKAVKAMLDQEKIKLEGATLLGLDDQLKAIKESDSYLFDEENQGSTGGGANPSNTKPLKDGVEADMLSAMWGGTPPQNN